MRTRGDDAGLKLTDPSRSLLPLKTWLMDRETERAFRVLEIGPWSVLIEEISEIGGQAKIERPRWVNRLMVEGEFAKNLFIVDKG